MASRKEYIITIEEPCHEKWEGMQRHTGGKFCGSCVKAVIDFTKLSDAQVLKIIENANGKSLCGRFDSRQINRIMARDHMQKGNPALYKVLAGLLLLATVETATAQAKPPLQETTIESPLASGHIMGKLAIKAVRGRVTGNDFKPVAGATILAVQSQQTALTGDDGYFAIEAVPGEGLVISSEGFYKAMVKAARLPLEIRLLPLADSMASVPPRSEKDSVIVLGMVSATELDSGPLYIVDGHLVDSKILESIRPERIKSVNVLKDAASTAIYGRRGANGTVVVTTDLSAGERKALGINNRRHD